MPERRLSFILLSTFLTLFLGGWVLSSALDRTIGEPAQAKDLLNRSGIYQAVVPAQLSEAGRSNPALANLPLDHPEVQKILSTSLGGKQVQTEGDKAVDSLYAWLEGTSPKPDITITAKPDASALAASLSNLAAAHAAKLPTCAPGDAAAVAAITADPLSAKCLPAGVTAETVRGFVSGEVATNPALSAPVTVTEDDLLLPGGKSVTDTFSAAPVWYQRAQLLPLVTGIGTLVCIALLFLILRPLQASRRVGKQLLVVGMTLAGTAFALAWATSWLFETLTPRDLNPTLASALADLTTLFHNAFRDNIIRYSLYPIAAGAVLLLIAFALKLMHKTPTAAAAGTGRSAPAPESPHESPLAAAAKPHKKPATHTRRKAAVHKKK